MPRPKKTSLPSTTAESYQHPDADAASRPEIGTQAHFKRSHPPVTYRYDSSLAPELRWDGQNPAREEGEALILAAQEALAGVGEAAQSFEGLPFAGDPAQAEELANSSVARVREALTEARSALARIRALGRPFLDWAGKAERLSFEAPTLPLFVHERLSTKAILETLAEHRADRQTSFLDDLFGTPQRPLIDQILQAYEHRDRWVNRLVLGDSLVVMNSLLGYEALGGQVQMIYMDPPYGVKFGSNFQPFIRRREVKHNEDGDLTREPEMVQAYRDTWELGLHSYLTYLRDRLLLSRELLTPSGSIFVQISDENLHHVREVLDEVFGAENFVANIVVKKTGGLGSTTFKSVADYLLWFARDKQHMKFCPLYDLKELGKAESTGERYDQLESPDGKTRRALTKAERENPASIPAGWRAYQLTSLTSGAFRENTTVPYKFEGETFHPGDNLCWKTTVEGLDRLKAAGRIVKAGRTLRYVRYLHDFPAVELTNIWDDVAGALDKLYVVQTTAKVIQRCMLMTTSPGDLVLDPTCGSGTTAVVAEQWGRRWITIDTSRVPLALARQRLLSATFDYYELQNPSHGPAGGFCYRRRQNARGEEVGGLIPHVTLKNLANDEPPAEEVLVDRPEVSRGLVRVTGPFTVEATLPAAVAPTEEAAAEQERGNDERQNHVARMIEVLRRAPQLRLPGNQVATLRQIRPPAKRLTLSAEALLQAGPDSAEESVAILFGPENGPLMERLVREAWDEAGLKRYSRLLVIGFGIDPKAREFVERAGRIGIPCLYLQATMDLQMGDLLKNMRSSQIFSICGLPDVEVRPLAAKKGAKPKAGEIRWEVELLGLDTFDPATMEPAHLAGSEVPAWLLDTDYNGLVFRVRQAFFPRTGAWDNLKKGLRTEFEPSVWEHLAGTVSAPFVAGDHGQVAVKVIDPRGNELLVVKALEGAFGL